MKSPIQKDAPYFNLLDKIGGTFNLHKEKSYRAVNKEVVQAYWKIGQHIVEYEQEGQLKASYGKQLILELAKDLKTALGKGFSRTNLIYMRRFYLKYPKSQTLSDQLSWSHYVELLSISDDLERSFYERQSLIENWSIRELKRQKKTALFHRLALSKDKSGVLELSKQGHEIKTVDDLTKDPYIFEFLGLSEKQLISETSLERKLIEELQAFLLELGKGFAFVGQQYRISLNNTHYRVDLVFYHFILKCFVLIDLKVDKLKHYDVGQMNMYLNYFKTEVSTENDNEPIGIILTTDKDEILVEYALGGITNQLFVSKYQIYLPNRASLEEQLKTILEDKTVN